MVRNWLVDGGEGRAGGEGPSRGKAIVWEKVRWCFRRVKGPDPDDPELVCARLVVALYRALSVGAASREEGDHALARKGHAESVSINASRRIDRIRKVHRVSIIRKENTVGL